MEKTVKLSPPWNTFVSELKILFGEDPDINVQYYDGDYEVKLFVEGYAKANALTKLLPATRVFGNVVFNITIVPSNKATSAKASLIEEAFKGNPVLSEVMRVQTPFGEYDYAMFRKQVVQFYNDDLSDPHGYKSTLYQDIAKDVFGTSTDIFFCTDTKNANK